MKNLFFIVAAIIGISLSSCQKGAKVIPLNSRITATIDGTDEVFDLADSVRLNGTNGAFLTGTNAANKDCIRIYLGTSSGTFGAGTYYTAQPGEPQASNQIMFLVAGSETDGYYTYYTEPYETDPGFQYFGTITVSNFSSTQLQGSFSGSLVAFSSVTPGANNPLKTKTITNGKFSIFLNNQP